MLTGLIQNRALQISNILDYAVRAHGRREIVSRLIDEPLFRYDYSGLGRRAARLAHGLVAMGAKAGDTFSSLAWNTHRHRSEEHTSELQSLMRISYAVFCLKKKKTKIQQQTNNKN